MLNNPEKTYDTGSKEAGWNLSKSPLRNLYKNLSASTPLELSNNFTELDQEEMRSGKYNYDDKESEVNKIKDILDKIDTTQLTDDENRWRNEMLWLWNHHAAGYALFGHKDHETAQYFIEAALAHQAEDHPNKITKLLDLLSRDDVAGATDYIATIPHDSVEHQSALVALEMYKQQIVS